MLSQLIQCDVYTENAAPIHFVQGEEGRQLQFNFINSIIDPVNPIDLTGKTVTIHILKPDNTFTVEHCTVSQTSATYTLTENDCAAGGIGVYDLSIEDSGLLIYTAHGEYQGDYAAVEPGSITSYSQIFGLTFPDDFQLKLAAGANITIDTSQVPNIISSSGGGGTSDYTALTNKPSINGVTLSGNKTSSQLNITDTTYTAGTGLDLTGTVFSLDATVASNISTALTKATAAMTALGSDYDPDVLYVVGDYCMYNSIMYKCNTDTTGAWDSTVWDETKVEWEFYDIKALAYDIGDYVIALANAVSGGYDSSTTYNPNDIVAYNNYLYKCTATTTGSWDSTKWTQITVGSELTALENKSVPAGGTSGQVLTKSSSTDYDFTWSTPGGGGGTAASVTYDNTVSGLTATNVQDAIDEVVSDISSVRNFVSEEYDSTLNYDVGTYCIYNDHLYVCTAYTGGGAFDPTAWDGTNVGNGITDATDAINTINSNIAKMYLDNSNYHYLGASVSYGSSYTAPATGIYFIKVASSATQGAGIYYDSGLTAGIINISSGGGQQTATIPMKQGAIIYTANNNTTGYYVYGYIG